MYKYTNKLCVKHWVLFLVFPIFIYLAFFVNITFFKLLQHYKDFTRKLGMWKSQLPILFFFLNTDFSTELCFCL